MALPEQGLRSAGRPELVGPSFPAPGHYRLAGCRVKDALGGAARPGLARSLTRPSARTRWQRRGKGSRSGVCCWGRRLVAGLGVAYPKSRCWGCKPATLVSEPFPRCPPRLAGRSYRGCPGGVGLQAGEDGIADLPLQAAQGFFAGLAFGQFLLVVGVAGAVPVADLGDGGHVDGVVEPSVAAPGQPPDLAAAGGHLDRGGAVIGGEGSRFGKRATCRTSPMAAAAITGPAPNSPVRLVPAARTAPASLVLVWRIATSTPRRSPVSSAASSQRAACTVSAGVIVSRTRRPGLR